jgi:hypothetical protein
LHWNKDVQGGKPMRGRRPAGPEYVDKLDGDPVTRHRLRVILQTVAQNMPMQDACEMLGIREVRLHQLRQRALQGALDAIAPRPPGRPSLQQTTPEAHRLRELEQQVAHLELQLREAQVREEIALIVPHLVGEEEVKKTR